MEVQDQREAMEIGFLVRAGRRLSNKTLFFLGNLAARSPQMTESWRGGVGVEGATILAARPSLPTVGGAGLCYVPPAGHRS